LRVGDWKIDLKRRGIEHSITIALFKCAETLNIDSTIYEEDIIIITFQEETEL
jgi:hypothetical protein